MKTCEFDLYHLMLTGSNLKQILCPALYVVHKILLCIPTRSIVKKRTISDFLSSFLLVCLAPDLVKVEPAIKNGHQLV